jgi:hypothetical protein
MQIPHSTKIVWRTKYEFANTGSVTYMALRLPSALLCKSFEMTDVACSKGYFMYRLDVKTLAEALYRCCCVVVGYAPPYSHNFPWMWCKPCCISMKRIFLKSPMVQMIRRNCDFRSTETTRDISAASSQNLSISIIVLLFNPGILQDYSGLMVHRSWIPDFEQHVNVCASKSLFFALLLPMPSLHHSETLLKARAPAMLTTWS